MTFYDRYARIADERGLDPCSQRAADMFGCTRATISSWNTKNTTPKGETVAIMADKLNVSADYLLGRTDDPTDYAKAATGPRPVRTALPPQKAPAPVPMAVSSSLLSLLGRLDGTDLLKIEGVVQGMLMADKYSSAMPDAAHARTDIKADSAMAAHDSDIMDAAEF